MAKGYKNTASLFIERAVQLLKAQGIFGLVIPKSLTFSQKWKVVRDYILQNLHLLEIADISKAFPGVLLEQIILLCRKEVSKAETYRGTDLAWEEEGPVTYDIPFSLCREMDAFPVHVDAESLAVYKKVMSKSVRMGEISKTSRGLPLQSKATKQRGKNSEPLLRGDDIKRYYQSDPKTFIDKSILREDSKKIIQLRKPKIISQRIVAHVLKPVDRIIIMSMLDRQGLLSVDTVENTIITDDKYDLGYVLAFLNSKLVSWFTYLFIFNKAVRTMDFDNYYVGKIPIFPASREQQKPFVELVEKITTLTKELAGLNVNFGRYINSVPRQRDITFKSYCTRYATEEVTLIESNKRGQIKGLSVEEKNKWLILRIDYKTKIGQETKTLSNVKAFKCKIDDESVRKFLFHSLLNYRKRMGSGNILSKIQSISIACFHKDREKNEEIICKLMKDYLKALDKQTTLQRKIQATDDKIDQKIYRFYGLCDKEISMIEKSVPRYFIKRSFYA